MLVRMVSISCPRDPPASASQSAGIIGVSHRAWPKTILFLNKHTWLKVHNEQIQAKVTGETKLA